MPLYYFDLHECGTVFEDEQGCDFAGLDAARANALIEARALMAAEVQSGRLCLSCHISILDSERRPVLTVPFREALALSGIAQA